MEQWRKDARNEAIIVDLEALVPQDHLLRKIEKVMDYEWLYERLDPYDGSNLPIGDLWIIGELFIKDSIPNLCTFKITYFN